jgi:predicted membrane GTPase involved in stress response
VEVTPSSVRVRKRVLQCSLRDRRTDAIEQAQGA